MSVSLGDQVRNKCQAILTFANLAFSLLHIVPSWSVDSLITKDDKILEEELSRVYTIQCTLKEADI